MIIGIWIKEQLKTLSISNVALAFTRGHLEMTTFKDYLKAFFNDDQKLSLT